LTGYAIISNDSSIHFNFVYVQLNIKTKYNNLPQGMCERWLEDMGKHTRRNVVIAVILIVIITAGVYLGLSYPFPAQSTPISLSGIITQEDIPVTITWPNAQMQVSIHLSSVTALWGFEIRDASNNYVHGQASIDTSTTTVTTPWLDASGSYMIIITCVGDLEGTVTVFARGWPFIPA
jgi:hypothetical protein